MRKTCFAMTLVLAAFAGGAAMNGPGLAWLKARVTGALQARLIPAEPAAPSMSSLDFVVSSDRTTPANPDPQSRSLRPSPTIALVAPPPKSDAPPIQAIDGPIDVLPTLDSEAIPTSSAASASIRDWDALRKRLREAGVGRYELETELGGRSRFRCLVPLAGRRAVGQQFEGEGDDDFQAAEAALRRLSLWRATELQSK